MLGLLHNENYINGDDRMLRIAVPTRLAGLLLCSVLSLQGCAQGLTKADQVATGKHKVVFQVSENDGQKWELTLNNVANIQKDVGKDNAELEVVTYGPGINMLKMDSKVALRIKDALASGVKIVACENTMRGQHLTKEDMLPDIGYVPSGVVELIKLQEQGYSYIKP